MAKGIASISCELIDGAPLESILVHQALNQHWTCEIVCRQSGDAPFSPDKFLGQDLKVNATDEDGATTVLFDGFVIDFKLEYGIYGTYRATIRGITRTWKMSLTPRHAYYKEKTLSDIAPVMAGRVGLSSTVNAPARRALRYMQWAESDFDFLLRVINDYGCWLRPTGPGFEVQQAFQATTTLQWRQERGLMTFQTEGTLAPTSFGGAHYNFHEMRSKTWTNVQSDPSFSGAVGSLVGTVKDNCAKLPAGYVAERSRVVKLDEFENLLKDASVRSLGSRVTASGESLEPKLQPGDQIQIEGIEAQGAYGLTEVTHAWTSDGYRNVFRCTPWQNYTNPSPPLVNRCYGVVPGRVVEHDDPKKMGRIKIQFYWQEDAPTEWARMMTPHAGGGRGFMFMPEKGDEVVVAFEDGDPERPVVLGCVWNGVDTAPRETFWGDDIAPNDVKRVMTKSGTRFQMVDKEGKQSMMFSTPNSVRIALMESSNETHRETLLLHTDLGDIILSAPNGRVHVHSKFYSREAGDHTPT
jgi:type VI secretion system secreted protein VgrG